VPGDLTDQRLQLLLIQPFHPACGVATRDLRGPFRRGELHGAHTILPDPREHGVRIIARDAELALDLLQARLVVREQPAEPVAYRQALVLRRGDRERQRNRKRRRIARPRIAVPQPVHPRAG
jgi:hypothetical protein